MNSDYAEIRSLYIIDAAADAVGDSTPHPRDLFARRGFAIWRSAGLEETVFGITADHLCDPPLPDRCTLIFNIHVDSDPHAGWVLEANHLKLF